MRFVRYCRRRCSDTDPKRWWPHYGAKGIRAPITGEQLEEIWLRDNAAALRKPSLDRKDSNFDYANWNVRFIEFDTNAKLAWLKGNNFMAGRIPPPETVPEFT